SISSHTLFLFYVPLLPVIYTLSYTTLFRSRPIILFTNTSLSRDRWPGLTSLSTPPPRPTPAGPHLKARMSPPVDNRTHPARKMADRKSTRLNSSHVKISYAVFCLKKKKNNI